MDNWPVQLRLFSAHETHSLYISNLIITERSILGRSVRRCSCEVQLWFLENYEIGILPLLIMCRSFAFLRSSWGYIPATCLIYAFAAGTTSFTITTGQITGHFLRKFIAVRCPDGSRVADLFMKSVTTHQVNSAGDHPRHVASRLIAPLHAFCSFKERKDEKKRPSGYESVVSRRQPTP